MRLAEVSVPGVPTDSSLVLFHRQSIFPSHSDPFRLKDAHDKEAPTTSYGRHEVLVASRFLCALASPSWSSHRMPLQNCTLLYTIVGCGGAFFFRGFHPSTSTIMSFTAFAVKSLYLRSDIRFRASCTEADDGVDTDVIRAVCRGT